MFDLALFLQKEEIQKKTEGSKQNRYATICSMLQFTDDKIVGYDEYYNKKTSLEELQEYCNIENTKAIKNILAFIGD